MAAFALRPDVECGRACRVCARTRLAPWKRMEPVADRNFHQPVPGWMELDLVDPVAETIVRAQHRRVGVGLEAPVDRLLRTRKTAQLANHVLGPRPSFPLERLAQRRVGFEQVVVDERWRLVEIRLHRLFKGGPDCNELCPSGVSIAPPSNHLYPVGGNSGALAKIRREIGHQAELLFAFGG